MDLNISFEEIEQIQNDWGNSIINIGKIYIGKGDYNTAAKNHVKRFYGYEEGKVLFKPTLASLYPFRLTVESAESYFVGGNPKFPRDSGFALKPWINVRFENAGIIIMKQYAVSMGNYFFRDLDEKEEKVEFSLGFFRSENGNLKINLHHSSLPFDPVTVTKQN